MSPGIAAFAFCLLPFIAVPVRAQLVITPVYTAAILADPQKTAIMSTVNSAISMYESTYTNSIDVSITFDETTTGLATNSTRIGILTYQSYSTHLHTDKQDSAMVAYVPIAPVSPINNIQYVRASLPALRAVGYVGSGFNPPTGKTDSTILFNIARINTDRTAPQDPAKFDLMALAEHEIDEALGLNSSLDGLANNASPPTGPGGVIAPSDLYRYSAPGTRSLTPSGAVTSYFSIDNGVTNIVGFNQNASPTYQGGDYQDWTPSATPRVQDAFYNPGQQINFGPAEDLALQAIGYNVSPLAAPEASPLVIVVVGGLCLSGLGVRARRRRTSAFKVR